MTVSDGELLSFSYLHASLCRMKRVCSADRDATLRFKVSQGKVIRRGESYIRRCLKYFFSILSLDWLGFRKVYFSFSGHTCGFRAYWAIVVDDGGLHRVFYFRLWLRVFLSVLDIAN